jgi:hypothetical protein
VIDLYCERVGPGLWAEPFNVLSNAAYLVVAWALWREVTRHAATSDRQARVLALLPLAIAVGSSSFHLFATSWARRMDEAPILAFELLFLWMFARRRLGWPAELVAVGVCAFALAVGAGKLVHFMNGSVSYFPPLTAGIAIGAHAWRTQSGRVDLLLASVLFAFAIGFRVIDTAVCGAFPIGTHFLWHLLTAVVLFLFGRAAVR